MDETYHVAIEILEWYEQNLTRANLGPSVYLICPICQQGWRGDTGETHSEGCWIPKLKKAQWIDWGEG